MLLAPEDVRRRWLVADAALVVVCVATSVSLALGGPGPGTHVAGPLWLSLPWAVLQYVPLLWRRRAPLAVCTAVMGALAVLSLATWESPMGLEVIAALATAGYSASAYASRRHALLALVPLTLGYLAYSVGNVDVRAGGAENYWAASFFAAGTAGAWLIGLVLRTHREEKRSAQAQELRQREVEAALVAERGRLARELHDVVSHQLSVVVVQAAGARAQQQAGHDATAGTLEKIETSGREALVEMRRLLDVLRAEDDEGELRPSPGVGDVTDLVEGVRSAGLPVGLDVAPEVRDVPPVVGLAVYRVVQEALTNTLKHAAASRVQVSLCRQGGEVVLEVVDDGTRRPDPAQGGYGLVGMRERVSLLGGTLSAGPVGERGFAVRATVPVGDA